MEESIDVKALRARFNNKPSTSSAGSRDSGSPKSPRPGFGRAILPVTESELTNRLSPIAPASFPRPPPGPGVRASNPSNPSNPSYPYPHPNPHSYPHPHPHPHPNPNPKPHPNPNPNPNPSNSPTQPGDIRRVKQTGELLQNIMLRHQRPSGVPQGPALSLAPAPTSSPLPLRQPPRQRSLGDVVPLRKPLPPEGPVPLKPKRPSHVNLEPFLRLTNRPALPAPRKTQGLSESTDRRMSLPVVISPPQLPQRFHKPRGLPHQIASQDIEDGQDTYDDIASFGENESFSDNGCEPGLEENDDEIYEFIDEDQLQLNHAPAEKTNKKDAKKQQEQEKKERIEHQKKLNSLKKNFQLEGEEEVLHTARVRQDWQGGGKLDLSVRQGENVDIIRVKNNPGGKWLARSLNGNYGYISNTCVDVDYEAVKRKVLQSRIINPPLLLPPPPPDPPQLLQVESNSRDSNSFQDDDDYDDVQPLPDDFPPPPPEISIDPKVEKEVRKRFKFDGPLTVLHTMMVDPNCVIKKPGGKDLHVTRGEILDIIQFTNTKKALCRNSLGKYGYVFRSYLLPLEGDIYDDVDYADDVYDNDAPFTGY